MTSRDLGTDRYELVDRIATGGMAEVYQAKAFGAHGFEKTLAIKRILPELASEPEFEDRFISEAKLAVGLSHANVVQVLDFGRFAGSLFIAMEYIDGLDLARLLRVLDHADEKVPVAAALQIAIELCRGLDYAHKHDVVHRDVSPSNILLSRAGEVKIADFGIAQAVRGSGQAPGWKRIMGKWRYMSPEQTRGDRLSTGSDLFSAASVMFELFTGDKLFPGQEPDAIADNIAHMPIPSVTARRAELPPRIDEVLAGALARDKADRTDSAAIILRELTEISYENGLVATPLDVADLVDRALSDVERAEPSTGIDAQIRAQLSGNFEAEETGRQTALGDEDEHGGADATGSALIASRVDSDGITVWELDRETIAAAPSAMRDGRKSGAQPVIRDHEPAVVDKSRRNHVTWLRAGVAVAAVVVAVLLVVWQRTGAKPVAADAGPRVTTVTDSTPREMTKLRISSRPPGAQVFVDDRVLPDPTPTEAEVEPQTPVAVRVELAGYAAWVDDSVSVPRGETMRIVASLRSLSAALQVDSDPAGADVFLDGKKIGTTPLRRNDLRPGPGRTLAVIKDGFRRQSKTIVLDPKQRTSLSYTLRRMVVMGTIDLQIDDGWADVYLKGKRVGRAPVQGLRLPAGRHSLKLVNPPSGKTKYLNVNVLPGKRNYYRTRLVPGGNRR